VNHKPEEIGSPESSDYNNPADVAGKRESVRGEVGSAGPP